MMREDCPEEIDDPLSSREPAAERLAATRIAARVGRGGIVFLDVREVLAFEMHERLAFVHASSGRFDVDLSLTELQIVFGTKAFLRVHRSWLIAVSKVRELRRDGIEYRVVLADQLGEHCPKLVVPVARGRFVQIRQRLLEDAVGLRKRGAEGPALP
jgi:DNA-binding LytR/AlgR family response regulator